MLSFGGSSSVGDGGKFSVKFGEGGGKFSAKFGEDGGKSSAKFGEGRGEASTVEVVSLTGG